MDPSAQTRLAARVREKIGVGEAALRANDPAQLTTAIADLNRFCSTEFHAGVALLNDELSRLWEDMEKVRTALHERRTGQAGA